MIEAREHAKQKVEVLGKQMAYVEMGGAIRSSFCMAILRRHTCGVTSCRTSKIWGGVLRSI